MAVLVQVTGLVSVYVDTELLGYSEDMVEVQEQGFHYDVPGDRHGGQQGPPIDVQYLGQILTVRLRLSSYDGEIANKVQARVLGGVAGKVQDAEIGALMLQDSKYFRLTLQGTNATVNMPIAFPREAVEINRGTKFSSFVATFQAHRNQATTGGSEGVLWDDTQV
jgi:hypothetical protein